MISRRRALPSSTCGRRTRSTAAWSSSSRLLRPPSAATVYLPPQPYWRRLPHPLRDLGPRRRHRAAVAERAEVLGRVEAERGGVADGAGAAGRARGADRLGAILEHADAAARAALADRADLCHAAVEMRHDDDGHGVVQHRLDAGPVERERRAVDVGVAHAAAGPPRGGGGVHAGVGGGHDDRVAVRSQRPDRELQRVGAIGDADAFRRAGERRELALERLVLGAVDVPAELEHPLHRSAQLRALLPAGARQVVHRHDAHEGMSDGHWINRRSARRRPAGSASGLRRRKWA